MIIDIYTSLTRHQKLQQHCFDSEALFKRSCTHFKWSKILVFIALILSVCCFHQLILSSRDHRPAPLYRGQTTQQFIYLKQRVQAWDIQLVISFSTRTITPSQWYNQKHWMFMVILLCFIFPCLFPLASSFSLFYSLSRVTGRGK